MLDSDEGELRTRRIHTDSSSPASSQFILKVSPKNNGSQHLVAGTELLAPGATLPKHRHLVQDEILLIQGGTAHVWLGDQERDLHAGGLVFIPANTWISGKNRRDSNRVDVRLLGAGVRGDDALQFRAGR